MSGRVSGRRGLKGNELHIPEMHKDLFSLTLIRSGHGREEPCGLLDVKGKPTTLPHSLPSNISPPESRSRLVERMPQLWMAAFDLQQVAQLPARLPQGETPELLQLGTSSQTLLPLSYVAWQPEGRRKAGM